MVRFGPPYTALADKNVWDRAVASVGVGVAVANILEHAGERAPCQADDGQIGDHTRRAVHIPATAVELVVHRLTIMASMKTIIVHLCLQLLYGKLALPLWLLTIKNTWRKY